MVDIVWAFSSITLFKLTFDTTMRIIISTMTAASLTSCAAASCRLAPCHFIWRLVVGLVITLRSTGGCCGLEVSQGLTAT